MTSRFEYVDYDGPSAAISGSIRKTAVAMERAINQLPDGRPKSLALTKLEESFMWAGKAIRDKQLTLPDVEEPGVNPCPECGAPRETRNALCDKCDLFREVK